MKVSTMIGAPAPNAPEFQVMNQELRATAETANINLGEIVLAYRLAIAGTLDTKPADLITYGQPLTVFHLIRVLQSYRRWRLGQQAQAGVQAYDEHTPTDEERIETLIAGAGRAWDTYRATGQIVDYGGAIHAFLLENGFISRDAEEIEAIRREARGEYKRTLIDNHEKQRVNVRDIRAIIDALDAGRVPETAAGDLKVIRRRISLRLYFEELIFAEEDLRSILKSKPLNEYKLNTTKQ